MDYQIQMGELLGKVIEGHPEFALIADANAEQLFVTI